MTEPGLFHGEISPPPRTENHPVPYPSFADISNNFQQLINDLKAHGDKPGSLLHLEAAEVLQPLLRMAHIAMAIDMLREEDGSSITFLCQNPEGNGKNNESIIVTGSWTNWEERRFTANNLRNCLAHAVTAMNEHRNPITEPKGVLVQGPIPDFIQGKPKNDVESAREIAKEVDHPPCLHVHATEVANQGVSSGRYLCQDCGRLFNR